MNINETKTGAAPDRICRPIGIGAIGVSGLKCGMVLFAACLFSALIAAPVHAQKSAPTDSIPRSGVRGAPNPMQDNRLHLTGEALLDDSFPNSWPIPGSGLRMRIGGFIKADVIQDLNYIQTRYEFETGTIPVEGTPEAALGGRSTLHANDSGNSTES